MEHSTLIWILPFFGLLLVFIIKKIPSEINQGIPYLLQQSDLGPQQINVSPWMAPYILLTSVLTHLFGGSAGREGVGVVMGASLSQLLPKFSKKFDQSKPLLIICGIAAGFSSIFGTPLAAIFFAFELKKFKQIKQKNLFLLVALSAYVAKYTTHLLGVGHHSITTDVQWSPQIASYVLIAILTASIGGNIFYWGMHYYTKMINIIFPNGYIRIYLGSLAIVLILFFTQRFEYAGISTDILARSFMQAMSISDFAMKCLLTIMTISLGFKGGEVTPLFVMGAILSNATAALFGLTQFALSSALGMIGLFAALSATPIASAIMGAELFGIEVGGLCLIVCLISRKLIFNKSIYSHS